jgi:integrase
VRLARFLRHEWLPAIATSVRPSTLAGYRLHVECHIVPRLGRLELTAIDARKLNALYASLLASGRVHGNGGLSPASVRRVHATVHRALRDAVRWGYLNDNPADLCDPPKVRASDGQEMTTWTAEQLRAFLRTVRRDELYPLWYLLAATGMRRGEALGLRWSDVDLRVGRLSVRQTVIAVGAEIIVSRPKTAKGRRAIALDRGTVSVLAAHKKRARPASPEHLVFCGPDGSPLAPNGFPNALPRWWSGRAFQQSGCTTLGTPTRLSLFKRAFIPRSCPNDWGTRPSPSRSTSTATRSTTCRRKRPRSSGNSSRGVAMYNRIHHEENPNLSA